MTPIERANDLWKKLRRYSSLIARYFLKYA